MRKTLQEIAQHIRGEIVGDKNLVVTGVCGVKEAQKGDLSFIANAKYSPLAEKTKASALIVPRDVSIPGKSVIRTDNPSLAFTKAVSLFVDDDAPKPAVGVHPTAVIADGVKIGKNVSIGPCAVIESKAEIGDGVVIGSGTYIGRSTKIGKDSHLYPHVMVREKISIGERVIIHSGAAIGSDGFGFINVDGTHQKIPQVGTVVIEDDVEIGANVTIDRARFDRTVVGRGTKIDNLVHIGHNVIMGKNCIVIAQVGISGSVIVEDNVTLAGQAGVVGHLTIGKGSVVAAQTGVTKSLPPNSVVFGMPSRPLSEAKRIHACMQKLPEYVKRIQELEAKVGHLQEKLKDPDGKAKNNKK